MKRFTLPIATQPQQAAALVKPKFAAQPSRDKQEVDGQVFVPRDIYEFTDWLALHKVECGSGLQVL
jgi:hypothetical protein